MEFKNKTRDEMIEWCESNPGVVVSFKDSFDGDGMAYNGTEMKYYFNRKVEGQLASYAGWLGNSDWFVPDWSPVKPEQMIAKHEFSVGDKAWSEKFGKGVVKMDSFTQAYPVLVEFESGAGRGYTSEGRYYHDCSHYLREDDYEKDIVPYTGQDLEDRVHKPLPSKSLKAMLSTTSKDGIEDKKDPIIKDRLAEQASWVTSIPDSVNRYLLGDSTAKISYANGDVSLGEGDYGSLEQMREAIEWLVEQFGGEVKWG